LLAALTRILSLVTVPGVPSGGGATSGTTSTAASGSGIINFSGPDTLHVGPTVAIPLLVAAEYLIPAAVALAGLHKLLTHQETGAGFLVDMLIKGGGAILIIQLVKSLTGLQ
jgi:hypothetical protein